MGIERFNNKKQTLESLEDYLMDDWLVEKYYEVAYKGTEEYNGITRTEKSQKKTHTWMRKAPVHHKTHFSQKYILKSLSFDRKRILAYRKHRRDMEE